VLEQTLADCESLGLDCSCYSGPGPATGGGGGVCADLDDRTKAVTDECCDEPAEDCSSGRPATCNLSCAHVLLPYFDKCAGALGAVGAAQFDFVIALCHAAEAAAADREKQIGGSGGSLEPPGPLLEPPGSLLTHLIPFMWRILSAFLPA
jgi:hypothetical protein